MAINAVKAHILGFPRVGEKRELKFALESFWRGESSPDYLQQTARTIRAAPDDDQLGFGKKLHPHADLAPQRLRQAFAASSGANGAVQERSAQ